MQGVVDLVGRVIWGYGVGVVGGEEGGEETEEEGGWSGGCLGWRWWWERLNRGLGGGGNEVRAEVRAVGRGFADFDGGCSGWGERVLLALSC